MATFAMKKSGHEPKNFMAKAIWNMATLAIYGHSWEHCGLRAHLLLFVTFFQPDLVREEREEKRPFTNLGAKSERR